MSFSTRLFAAVAVCVAVVGLQNSVPAQDADSKATIDELIKRLERVEQELAKLRAERGELPPNSAAHKVLTMLETPFLGQTYYGSNGGRYFAAKVLFINLTSEAIEIKKDDISLLVDGKEFKLVDVPTQMQYQSFQVGNQSFQLRDLKAQAKLAIKPGGTGSTWAVFTALDKGGEVPDLVLQVKNLGDKKETKSLNVNEIARGVLGLEIERIGPQRSLALMTVGGTVNTINAGALVREVEKLVEGNVVRFVVRWTDSATPVDSSLMSWLQQCANQAGRPTPQNSGNQSLPVMPVKVRELHLAEIPNRSSGSTTRYSSSSTAPRIHAKTESAVAAALKSAYERLPLPGLLEAINNGHKMTRVAALASGGGRLSGDYLPLVLKYSRDEDPLFQRAAMMALRHFGQPEAIARLVEVTKQNNKLSPIAIESLASSRFAVAHDELLKLLQNETPESAKKIVTVLAKYPRSIWAETLYTFASDPNSGVTTDAMKALAQVGHPKLHDVLKEALASSDKKLRDDTFNILVARVDSDSEELAMTYTLEHIKDTMPTSQMYSLLGRTKDQRAVPFLIQHFENASSNRSQLISTLSSLGGKEVVATFLKKYDQLETYEQSNVLEALARQRVPEYRKLTEKALKSNNDSLIRAATQALQNDGSNAAVDLLVDAFAKITRTNSMNYIASALGNIGTPKARAALVEARKSKNSSKRSYAINALRNLEQRSPGYQYVAQARALAQQKKTDEAIKLFTRAIEVDDALSDAYAGRGHAYLVKKDHKKALVDFDKTIELNDMNSVAVTGKGICLVFDGKVDDAVKVVEDARKRFTNDNLYAYNAACMYSRASVHLLKETEEKDEEKAAEFKKKAIGELQRAVKLGFRNVEHIKEDEDLTALREMEEFKNIVAGQPAAPRVRPKL